jgi:DNA (cytosine-5)-methyltransferase 1
MNNKILTVGSLFSGIGGFELGLQRAGMEISWMVEIDPFCRRVLAKNWPNVDRSVIDVKEAGKHNLRAVDLICGGFPCQDLSHSGGRRGLAGERSGLWFEYARIIREITPRWVLVENVPGLLSIDDGRGFGTVLRNLAESGYDAEWDCLPAAAFGADHVRDRVYIVAYTSGIGLSPVIQYVPGFAQHQMDRRTWNGRRLDQPGIERMAHGIPFQMEQLAAYGNAVVPQIAEWLGHRVIEAENRLG